MMAGTMGLDRIRELIQTRENIASLFTLSRTVDSLRLLGERYEDIKKLFARAGLPEEEFEELMQELEISGSGP
jgi:hypothetical protein